jgi:hypothetical protein
LCGLFQKRLDPICPPGDPVWLSNWTLVMWHWHDLMNRQDVRITSSTTPTERQSDGFVSVAGKKVG